MMSRLYTRGCSDVREYALRKPLLSLKLKNSMNIIRKTFAASAALVLSLGFAFPVAALNVDGAVNAATQGTVRVGADVDAKADVGVTVDNSSTSGSGTVKVQVGDVNGDGVAGMAATGTVSGDPDFDLLIVTRAEVDAGSIKATVSSPSAVSTRADLSGYLATEMKTDKNISSVEVASDGVEVTYKQHAKLFGFIPVTVDATAEVDADGKVEVSYPWYSFLMVTNKSDLETRIQNRVDADANLSTSADASANAEAAAQLGADAQARIVAAVKAAMQAEFNASINASANGTVSVQ